MHWQARLPEPKPGASVETVGEGAGLAEKRPFALDVDEGQDVLFLRGPQVARTIPIPGRMVSSTLERFGSQLLLGNLALFAVGLAAAAWLAHRMTRPLAALAATAERVGEGDFGATVDARGPGASAERASGRIASDEVTRAVASFNRMSSRLADLDRENRRLAEAEQLSELGDVARGLAHSLRNPLNALGLSIERLGARVPEDDSSADLVDGSRRQIRRIDGALRSFLALASSGGVESEPVDVAALARETALEALHDAAGARGGAEAARAPRIEVDSAAGERFLVSGVAAELKAILQALVVNACEATRSAEAYGGLVKIRLAPGRGERGDGLTVVVEDDGPGIPESVRARLFTPHVTTKAHGSGMGLFLAHRLATARYGGALRLEARDVSEGGGTRAVVELGDRIRSGA
jgi:signal transduction histidine kinase